MLTQYGRKQNFSIDYLRLAITPSNGSMEDCLIAMASLQQSIIPLPWILDLIKCIVLAREILVHMMQTEALHVLA